MISKKDYFRWMIKTKDGLIYFTDGIKLKDLVPPYTFSLLDGYKVISEVEIKPGEERVYFRRVFNKNTNPSPTHVLKILYCVGKKKGDTYICDVIHPMTKEIIKYTGKNLDEVVKITEKEMKEN